MKNEIKKTLEALEEFQSDGNNRWNISPETGAFLNLILKLKKAKKALEIGTSNGYSGIWLTEALSQQNGTLITIESHIGRFKEAAENFKKAGLSKYINQIQGHAPEVLPEVHGNFDFMFFDATKSEHSLYFKELEKKLKPGGIIITDNLNSHTEKLKDFIEMIRENKNFQSSEIPIGTGLMLSIKLT